MSIIDAALSRSRTVMATLVLVLMAGTFAFMEIAKEAEPDINIPIIYVSLVHEGISPEDAERLLICPMEVELRSIEGVKEMRAKGFEGGAYLVLEFDAGFDADQALLDVREQVDIGKPELPEDTEEPVISEVNFSLFPVLVVILSGNVPERTLLRLSRDLRDSIEGISSVLQAEIAGDREELVEVLIDPVKVESYGLSPQDAIDIVQNSNMLIAAGAQDTGRGRFSVKVPGLFETTADIRNLPIRVSGDAVVTLSNIAEIRRSFKDPEGFARVGGRPAIALEVSKRTGENIIETVDRVREVVAEERAAWPEGLRDAVVVSYVQDKSNDIRTMLNDLQNSVLFAVILVMVVVVVALGVRSAGLVGIAIPGSFLTGILVLAALGMTINIVVLFSLILAVGMLAAFLPLVFWPGVVGEFMKFLPITVLATLSASLLMALVFVPTLGSFVGKPGAADPATMRNLAGGETGDVSQMSGFTGWYTRLLDRALRHPVKILLVAVALLIGVQVTYANFGKGIEFFPDVEPEVAILQVRARGNLSVFEKDALLAEVGNRILDMDEFESVYTRTGTPERSEEAEDIIGTITVEFVDWELRRPAKAILDEVLERTSGLAGVFVDPREQEAGPPVGKPVQVELASRFPDALPAAIGTVRSAMENLGGLVNIEDSRPLPGIEWEVRVDRAQAAKFGVDVNQLGRAVQMVTTGIKVGEYRPDDTDDEIDIRVRYPTEYRTIETLDHIRINSEMGNVPIGNFVERTPQPKVGSVNRTDSRRVMTVKADVAPGVLADDRVQALQAKLREIGMDPRVSIRFKGEDEEQRKAEAFLSKAFVVALFIMGIILVTQFNSFYSAFLILSAVVMSTIGVFIGLLVTGQPFGIVMGGIGIIALAGIVVNNNIVLIDTFDRLRQNTRSAREAILRTGAQRLRPVMLTTITTVLGLLPLVFQVNIDFLARHITVGAPATQWWSQLATAIVFGLVFATVLTLVVTPSALMFRANVSEWRHRRRARRLAVVDSAEAAE